MDSSIISFIDQIKSATVAKSPLRIRGGGSKDFYGEPFDAALPILDTRSHSGIVSYEPSELVITVKAGTALADVEAALAEKNQCFAFEPPHYGAGARLETSSQPLHDSTVRAELAEALAQATIGGMVAAGLAGPARACVGGVRDYVLGAHLVNGRGELLQFGGQVMKNVAGYDVSRALAGSLGTLGLITQVSLKVLPIAHAQATLRFQMDEATGIRKCNEWAGQPLPLNASSWVTDQGVGTLYLRLRGAVAAVESACKRLANEAGSVRVDSPETGADWSAARDLQLPWFKEGFARGDDLWRISVPQTTAPLGLGDTMIDWLGGQRWLFTASTKRQEAAQRIRQAAQAVGGNTTLFIALHAYSMQTTARFDAKKPPLNLIHQQLKAEFDPAGIFNPGRLGVI
jgi:glycolate oxidase FAD binding subunit